MTKLEKAKKIHRNFQRRFNRLILKIRSGDSKAACKLIQLLTEETVSLRALGYMVADEGGKIVKFVPEKRNTAWTKD